MVVVVALAGTVMFGLLRKGSAGPAGAAAPVVGHPAPRFSLQNLRGQRVTLASQRGRLVLLNFWATWCIPCRQEMPLISALAARNRSTLAALAVDELEPASPVEDFVHRYHLDLNPLLDADGIVDNRYRVVAQPVTFWIDRQGIIRAIHYGAMSPSYAQSELRKLL